ncbi:MAG: GntR family transcriptional regulator [Novosphingobium sp.]
MAKARKSLQQVHLESGPIPLYHQLEQHLLGRLRGGEFSPGALLPTEGQLCAAYGVSRITVRKTLDSLMNQGFIIRRRGIGSFAAESHSGVHSVRLTGSLDEFLLSATQLQSQVLSMENEAAAPEVAKALELDAGDPVTRLELISSGGEGPLGLLTIYFPAEIGGMIALEDIIAGTPVIRLVEKKISTSIARANQQISPAIADEVTARHLGVPVGTPILRVLRTYYTVGGRPVEAAFIHYHPERYQYAVELRSRPQPA